MKRSLVFFSLSLAALCATITPAAGQLIGYVNRPFVVGQNLFANPLQAQTNTLSQLLTGDLTQGSGVPEGTQVSLWNPATQSFGTPSVFVSAAWTVDYLLEPGTGALLVSPEAFINTFVGSVLAPDGSPLLDPDDVTPPPTFAGPDGVYLLGSKFPTRLGIGAGTFGPVFEYMIGRGPREGEQFGWLDEATQTQHLTTFGGGLWDNGVPTLGVGQSAFFNIGPIPEPSTAALLALTLAGLWLGRRPQAG